MSKDKCFEMVIEGDVIPVNFFKGDVSLFIKIEKGKAFVEAYGDGFEFGEGLKGLQDDFIDIKSWGGLKIKYGSRLFEFFKNLHITANDAPDLSECEDMSGMFLGCHSFNGDLSRWDVGNVRYMRCMFLDCKSFNGNLSEWDVSNVKDMESMFFGCYSFTGDLSKWDVSNVKDMWRMFQNCESLKKLPEWYRG